MADITVQNLTKYYGDRLILKDISFDIQPGEKVAILGANGAGKTTLLNILTGRLSYDGGHVAFGQGRTAGVIDQMPDFPPESTVEDILRLAFKESDEVAAAMDALTDEMTRKPDDASLLKRYAQLETRLEILGGYNRDYEINRVCNGLEIAQEMRSQKFDLLSGGEKTRINLARIILEQTDVLLLDEPTNHLDIESIEWLESYLKEYNGAVVLISHDRAFLDNVTTRTIEISLGKATDYKVPYSRYVELRNERRQQQMAAYLNQQKMIEQTEDFIERFRYKPTKSNQVQSRIKQLEKIERIEIEEEDLATLNIKFPPAPRSGQVVVEAKEAGKSFGEKHVFSDATFTIERGEKVALVGRNGEGKTTFARLVIGESEPSRGVVRVGHNVHIGYYAQNQDDLMNGDFTVFDTLDRVAVGDVRTKLRDILGAFLFRGEDIDKKVKVLSGGERARLAMARLMLEPYNLLVLDEPTNHMDMRSKDILKNALQKYNGTVIVVSHDREFLDGLVDKVYEFRDGRVKEHLGGIYDFLRDRQLESMRELDRANSSAAVAAQSSGPGTNPVPGNRSKGTAGKSPANGATSPAKPALSGKELYTLKREADKQLRKAERDVEQAEEQIMALEKQIAGMDKQMADPTAHGIDLSDGTLYAQYNELKDQLSKLTYRWEELNIELENAQEAVAEFQ